MGDYRMASTLDAIQPCLDYLDKEMTIQGVLSGFSMAAAAAVFDVVLAAGKDASPLVERLQAEGSSYVIAGCAALVAAAALFYRERSDLAWLYSGFGLANADDALNTEHAKDSWAILECLDMFDSWHLWLWYRMGIITLGAAAVEFALAFIRTQAPVFSTRAPTAGGELDTIVACAVLASLLGIGWAVHVRLKKRDARCVPRKIKVAADAIKLKS